MGFYLITSIVDTELKCIHPFSEKAQNQNTVDTVLSVHYCNEIM